MQLKDGCSEARCFVRILVHLKKLSRSEAQFNELCFHEKWNRTVQKPNFNLSFKMTPRELIDRTGFSDHLLFRAARLKPFLLL